MVIWLDIACSIAVLQQPDDEASNYARRERAKAKKQRRRDREQEKKEQQKDEDKKYKDGNAGGAPVSTKSGRVKQGHFVEWMKRVA